VPMFAHHGRSAYDDMERAVCLAPGCHARPNPDLRIAVCTDCASVIAYAYHAKVRNDQRDQEPEEAARAAAGEFGLYGLVYFIRLGNRIKIGFTTNLALRMEQLPHEEILGVMPGFMRDEKRCHKAFAHLRRAGEWFEDAPELRAFIADVATAAA
jgi:hypothetical protein